MNRTAIAVALGLVVVVGGYVWYQGQQQAPQEPTVAETGTGATSAPATTGDDGATQTATDAPAGESDETASAAPESADAPATDGTQTGQAEAPGDAVDESLPEAVESRIDEAEQQAERAIDAARQEAEDAIEGARDSAATVESSPAVEDVSPEEGAADAAGNLVDEAREAADRAADEAAEEFRSVIDEAREAADEAVPGTEMLDGASGGAEDAGSASETGAGASGTSEPETPDPASLVWDADELAYDDILERIEMADIGPLERTDLRTKLGTGRDDPAVAQEVLDELRALMEAR